MHHFFCQRQCRKNWFNFLRVKMPQKRDILWDTAIHETKQAVQMENQRQEKKEGTQAGVESTIVVMGSKSAGKTSIILRFLEKEEQPKPTTALEYTFGRKAKGHNMTKDVAHIWELGGGTFLSELVEVPIKEDNILHSSIMLVLDLSHPNELWVTLEVLLKAALKRIEIIMTKLLTACPELHQKIITRSRERSGDHPDLEMIDPFLIPLVIVGMKYDVFQDFDAEKRKIIGRTLRFVAHHYGAALQFCSSKHEGLMNRTKTYVGHLVFGAPLSVTTKMLNFDHGKPVMIPFGMDSLEQIGLPPVAEDDIGNLNAVTSMDLWKRAYTSFFPQQSVGGKVSIDNTGRDTQYIEPAVDMMRKQKDNDLEQYRQRAQRAQRAQPIS